jgi:transcription-repair coupling factor (superfamily II helicase)
MILDSFLQLVRESGLEEALPEAGRRVTAVGLPGAAPAVLAAALGSLGHPLVVLVADSPGEAELLHADLLYIGADRGTHYLPQRETLPYEEVDPHVEISGQRAEALTALIGGRARLLVTTSRGLVERSPVGPSGTRFELHIGVGDAWHRDELAERLALMGFERATSVQELGDFVVRGGIVDVFPFGHDDPLRIELWDDAVASLRRFDPLTQRSSERIDSADILPLTLEPGLVREVGGAVERRSLLELLSDRTTVIEVGQATAPARRARLWAEIREARSAAEDAAAIAPSSLVLPPAEAESRLAAVARLGLHRDGSEPAAGCERLDFGLEPHPPIERQMDRLAAVIRDSRARGHKVLILCDNEGQLERLEEILEDAGGHSLAHGATLALGGISGGFRIPGPSPLLVLTDHQIFHRSRRLRRRTRLHGIASLESVASLSPGDYVVHMDHGIGRYAGMECVHVAGETVETLKIEYAEGEILRVPHYRLDLIEKWTGLGDGEERAAPPPVHKLGGKRWKALKARTVESIRAMATELLELYAHRQVSDGFAFSAETRWQREMESSFLYEDTPDQRSAWEDVRDNMESPGIMDRLVCGDVGYGKTEIAIRAAFKAVQDGKQVAVLAPTTILAEQHLHTFRERLASFPVVTETLSRLRTPRQQTETLEALSAGRIDIVVGTHRLLSGDVQFRNLGLLVVDEEQRFGVRHKEQVKELKRSVDVLTLTATPIPRTLQLALGGLRDMSLIETAPRDRMPVITHVLPWSDSIIRDAMWRELDRAGQIFFVHDRIETIDSLAQRVRRLLPEGRVAVAHGRMPERELERTMWELMNHAIDVLVSTSIIENGLDVPTANTMIVHRADRFGLAQLYQLRGRVGRSHHRAYCYLLVPPNVTPEAVQRLRILEHHTELGSGYRVALKDLQLRGAGNLLGADQSGFAQAVGFDTYQRLLEQTVRRMQGEEPRVKRAATQVAVDGDAFLPDEYIAGSDQKLHLYRRLSRLETPGEVDGLAEEMRDRFGQLPEAAERLLASVRLKLLGSSLGLEWARVSDRTARLNFRSDALPSLKPLREAFSDRQVAVEVRRTLPLSLVLSRAGVEPLLPTLIESLELLEGSLAGQKPAGKNERA